MARRLPARWPTKAHRAIACSVLLCVCAVSDVAARERGGARFQRQGFAHAAQADARGGRQAERAYQRGGPGRGGQRRESPMQQPPVQQQPTAPAYQSPEPPQQARPGRLTPDERRALRQQINEAGRDVYQPR